MSFVDALSYLYCNRSRDEELFDPFSLYCRMSDICTATYEIRRKVLLFYEVNKRLNIVQALLTGDASIDLKYSEVEDLLSESKFQGLMDSVRRALQSA